VSLIDVLSYIVLKHFLAHYMHVLLSFGSYVSAVVLSVDLLKIFTTETKPNSNPTLLKLLTLLTPLNPTI